MSQKMNQLCIYIICHNRPDDTRQVIRSALAQSDRDFSLTVSDNSSNDDVQALMQKEFPEVSYVRRQPMLAALDHFNCCIEEAPETYFCLFHDDDLLGPDFVKEVKAAISKFPEAIAIGSNAFIETQGRLDERPSFIARHPYEIIQSGRDLASRYFGRNQSGIAPFPGYVYRHELVGTVRFLASEGKYSDVTWLLRLMELGVMVWIRRPLMTYRLHGGNDGSIESRRDRLRFLAYLKLHRDTLGEGVLQDYRNSFIYKPLTQSARRGPVLRHSTARRFMSCYRFARYLRGETYIALLRRAAVKWMPSL
jgi:GT2 family glycosyltransferase